MSPHPRISSALLAAVLSTALALAGCWTVPVATVQPKGEARLIQKGVIVLSLRHAVVKSVDRGARLIFMQAPGDAEARPYKTSLGDSELARLEANLTASDFSRRLAGNKALAMVSEELTIYVSRDGLSPDIDGVDTALVAHAKVLTVDPSYRLLTLQHPDGRRETFKVERETKLGQMRAGDDVIIRTLQVVSLSKWQR